MVYTVTFSPSLDYIVQVPRLVLGDVNRTKAEVIYPGGKGINVSVVLKNLGVDSRALGFIGGFTGNEIERMLKDCGCDTDFITVKNGISRINVKIKSEQESEINGQGCQTSGTELEQLYHKLDCLQPGDTLVLAGSIPDILPGDVYEKLLERVSDIKINAVVDATGELLLKVLKYRPFLIKPNKEELGGLFDTEIQNDGDVAHYAKELQRQGARNVLVSMAGEGAMLLTEQGDMKKSAPPKGRVVNSVGAGDSMVAGFLAGYQRTSGDYEAAFRLGLAAGSATAFCEWLADKDEIERLL